MAVVYQPGSGNFRYSLFDCCGSCTDCLIASCLPDCYAFIAASDAGQGCCTASMNCLFYPLCLCCLRGTVRAEKGIQGSALEDLVVACCCPCCGYMQLRREYTGR